MESSTHGGAGLCPCAALGGCGADRTNVSVDERGETLITPRSYWRGVATPVPRTHASPARTPVTPSRLMTMNQGRDDRLASSVPQPTKSAPDDSDGHTVTPTPSTRPNGVDNTTPAATPPPAPAIDPSAAVVGGSTSTGPGRDTDIRAGASDDTAVALDAPRPPPVDTQPQHEGQDARAARAERYANAGAAASPQHTTTTTATSGERGKKGVPRIAKRKRGKRLKKPGHAAAAASTHGGDATVSSSGQGPHVSEEQALQSLRSAEPNADSQVNWSATSLDKLAGSVVKRVPATPTQQRQQQPRGGTPASVVGITSSPHPPPSTTGAKSDEAGLREVESTRRRTGKGNGAGITTLYRHGEARAQAHRHGAPTPTSRGGSRSATRRTQRPASSSQSPSPTPPLTPSSPPPLDKVGDLAHVAPQTPLQLQSVLQSPDPEERMKVRLWRSPRRRAPLFASPPPQQVLEASRRDGVEVKPPRAHTSSAARRGARSSGRHAHHSMAARVRPHTSARASAGRASISAGSTMRPLSAAEVNTMALDLTQPGGGSMIVSSPLHASDAAANNNMWAGSISLPFAPGSRTSPLSRHTPRSLFGQSAPSPRRGARGV